MLFVGGLPRTKPTLICENGYFHGRKSLRLVCIFQMNLPLIALWLGSFKEIDPCAIQMTSFVKHFIIHGRPTHAIKSIFLLLLLRHLLLCFCRKKEDRSRTLNSRLLSGCLHLCSALLFSCARFWQKGKMKMWSSLNTKWQQYESSQPKRFLGNCYVFFFAHSRCTCVAHDSIFSHFLVFI